MATTCDPMVYQVAERFMARDDGDPNTYEARVLNLACAIQQAAEDWIESERIDRAKAVEQQTLPMDGQGRR